MALRILSHYNNVFFLFIGNSIRNKNRPFSIPFVIYVFTAIIYIKLGNSIKIVIPYWKHDTLKSLQKLNLITHNNNGNAPYRVSTKKNNNKLNLSEINLTSRR